MTLPTPVPSTALRLTQIVFAIFFCLTCAGVIFGFAALKPVLIQEGVYADYCKPGERTTDPTTGEWLLCESQDIKLNFMFTLSAGVTNIACLPIGYTLDKLGPRKTSLLGATLFILGNFFFGLGYRSTWMDTYVLGFLFLALGGPLIFLPSFHLSNAFPAYSGLILSGMTGAFDASSIPYVVYRALYDKVKGGISLRTFFWFYTVIPFIVIVEQLFIGPPEIYQRPQAIALPPDIEAPTTDPTNLAVPSSDPFQTGPETPHDSAFEISASAFSRVHLGAPEDLPSVEAILDGKEQLHDSLHGLSARDQIMSWWFVCLTLFVCIHMARINFYIQSVTSQLLYYLQSPSLTLSLSKTFTLLLPLVGFLGIPLIGYLLDHRPWVEVPIILFLMGLGFGILGMSEGYIGQLAGILIFCLFRPLMYTALSSSFVLIFGFEHFGSVYGLSMTLSGLVGLLNAPLDVLVKTRLDGHFVGVDWGFVVLGCASAGWFVGRVRRGTKGGGRMD
ncbi:BZ3500_MvSof-1268-A1-R1_Chr1-2g01429 [Microbotryum saponariae]|uniref:BZ3500_MvSof-1268-A1-R1_Chr1-2g01429 protein n=1 Tax=Microbotryum saponariae TaxID=289078 RepID=A0A2X0KIJ3_9BASI|nr:BZ3500_MvSof-1268-A1-R1_Chr1-2g01429 [Microbotryum saponariae]